MANKFDLLTGRENSSLIEYQDFLMHPEACEQFKKLQVQAQNEIGADIQLVSSFRNFERQQLIWNAKAKGERKVLDDTGNIIDLSTLSELEKLQSILRFSALPGSSRHHWGTDFDIFDANIKDRAEVELTHKESVQDFESLHVWLDQVFNTEDSFGFFRPYDRDLGGVAVEKWHISFAPLAQNYFEQYSIEVLEQNIQQSEIELKSEVLNNLDFIFEKYLQNITLP